MKRAVLFAALLALLLSSPAIHATLLVVASEEERPESSLSQCPQILFGFAAVQHWIALQQLSERHSGPDASRYLDAHSTCTSPV